jgi:hypothetical protein
MPFFFFPSWGFGGYGYGYGGFGMGGLSTFILLVSKLEYVGKGVVHSYLSTFSDPSCLHFSFSV